MGKRETKLSWDKGEHEKYSPLLLNTGLAAS